MPRLFVATYLSPRGVQRVQQLARENAGLNKKWNARVRWVTEDKLHLTWLFLGDVDEDSVTDVADALGVAAGNVLNESPPGSLNGSIGRSSGTSDFSSSDFSSLRSGNFPTLSYDRLELWPCPRKARLGVIVPSAVPANIVELAKSISNNLSRFLTPEQQDAARRHFKPHLTVMRLGQPARRGGAHSVEFKARISMDDLIVPPQVFPIDQIIDRVELIESDMGKKVQGYITRASFACEPKVNEG